MNNDELERLTKIKSDIDRIEGVLKMFTPIQSENRYRLRSLIFPKRKAIDVKWGHSYGIDSVAFDLEYEDTVAIVEHFNKKLARLKSEFEQGS